MAICRSLITAAVGLALVASPGLARDVRCPASGEPAVSMSVPDDWTVTAVENGRALSIVNPDHRIGFTVRVAVDAGTTETVAQSMLKGTRGTLSGKQKTSLSGYAGETYSWSYMNAHAIKLNVTTILVKVGDRIAACSKMEVDNNPADERDLAQTVMQSVKIVPPGPGQ